MQCDVSSEDDVKRAVAETLGHFGGEAIDYLVNNAGISVFRPIEQMSLAEWNRIIGVNLTGAFLCTKYALPHLRKSQSAAIVNIASTRAFQSEPGGGQAYGASKGGIVALTHALAVDLGMMSPRSRLSFIRTRKATYGKSMQSLLALAAHAALETLAYTCIRVTAGPAVRVNCVSPGWIDVTGFKKTRTRAPDVLRPIDHEQHPCGRVGQVDDVARMVLFLLDPANSFLMGHNYNVDGGMPVKMIYEE